MTQHWPGFIPEWKRPILLRMVQTGESWEEAFGAILRKFVRDNDKQVLTRTAPKGAGRGLPRSDYPFTCEEVWRQAQLGKTRVEIAESYGETIGSINNWMQRHGYTFEKLREAYINGGVEALRAMDQEGAA